MTGAQVYVHAKEQLIVEAAKGGMGHLPEFPEAGVVMAWCPVAGTHGRAPTR